MASLRWLLMLAACLAVFSRVEAQSAPCGVVDAIDFPIDISDTLQDRYDDFGLHRLRFGGNHTGIDIAFNRWGDTIYAAARGEVTYSDPEGWDTEKGVVVIRHVFPDNRIYYTLYGHMEQTDTLKFPVVGTCVEKGDPVGAEGWPSRGLPHLHFEVRNFLPDDGGPGYVEDNPLLEGWYHPLDFVLLWQLRFAGGYIDSMSYEDVPTLPPVLLDTGEVVIASNDALEGYAVGGVPTWRVTMPGVITGLGALPGGRVAAHERGGQTVTLQNGRYLAVWQVDAVDLPFHLLGDSLVFATPDGGLTAYAPDGTLLWTHSGIGGGASAPSRAVNFSSSPLNGGQAALAVRDEMGSVRWQAVNSAGQLTADASFNRTPVASFGSGGWVMAADYSFYRVVDSDAEPVLTLPAGVGRSAQIVSDALGSAYLYLDDTGRTLLSVDSSGALRWRTNLPVSNTPIAPLLRVDNGCALYALDVDGTLRIFSAQDGELLGERRLYAGGVRNGSPPARLLQPQGYNRLLVSAGFLTLYLLDANAIADGALSTCVLG